LADSTSTGVAASYGFTTSDRGVMTMNAGTSITTDGDLSALSLTVGSDSTFNAATGARVSALGTIASTTVSVASDATTTGELSLGEVGSVHTAATVTLAEASANGADFNLIGKTFTSLSITLDGATAITVAAATDADSITDGNQPGLTVNFDGNAEAIAVYNNAAPTITALTLNVGTSTGTNTLDVSAASKATVTGGTGADTITGTAGADTISGGAGADTITGGAGADSMTGGTGADTFVFTTASTSTPSGTNFDTITDYTKASDVIDHAADIVKFATAVTAASGTAGVTVTTGVTSFNAADNTLALKVTAIAAALSNAAAGNTLLFQDGSDSYLYITDGTTGAGTTDVLIKLTGITGTSNDEITVVGGNITTLS